MEQVYLSADKRTRIQDLIRNRKITQATLYQHMGISYAINVATLLLVFLLRNTFPWDMTVVIVSTAIMLSLVGKLAPMSEIVSHVEEPVS